MKLKKTIIATAALVAAMTLSGCTAQGTNVEVPSGSVTGDTANGVPSVPELPEIGLPEELPPETDGEQRPPQGETEQQPPQEIAPEEPPVRQTVSYVRVTGDGVNIRKGAGTSFSSLGTAEKNTLYACLGREGSWFKTYYKNSTAYISSKYCEVVELEKNDDADVEKVIAEGTRHMGTKYVYGATRYHDGTGKLLSGFTVTQFDCSSLVQYIFKKAVNINLQVNTRTQVVQGTTVKKSELKRGDLIFFTNSSRKHLTGIERIGHVALYLGDNLILHTASDYAKIEEISSVRWGYYVQTQRMI